jgi:hypothetical protein
MSDKHTLGFVPGNPHRYIYHKQIALSTSIFPNDTQLQPNMA